MSDGVTIDDIWRLFQATDARLAQLAEQADRRHAEMEAAIAQSRQETEAAMAQSRREMEAAIAQSRQETEANRREIDRRMEDQWQRSLARSEALDRKLGWLSDRVGEFAEGMVIPAVKGLFKKRGIPVHGVARDFSRQYDGHAAQFDLLVVNVDHVVAVEVKSRVKTQDVTDHIDRMTRFKGFFPEYRTYKIMAAITGMTVDEDAARYAYRQGLFVLVQSGETVRIANDEKFNPKLW